MVIRQRGAALLVMLIVLMGSMAAVALGMLGRQTLSQKRAYETTTALAQTKAALIAWAIAHPIKTSPNFTDRPGGFPCPDTRSPGDFQEGTESSCTAIGAIGRIPWRTLGIPRPTDVAGNTLWYALSGNFRNRGSVVINSDTVAQYQVYAADGVTVTTPPGKEAVAIVFAAGAALPGQSRDAVVAPCPSLGAAVARDRCPSNYLESFAGKNNASRTGPYVAANASASFNDRLLYITKADFMRQIEMRVAREVLHCLTSYARNPIQQGHLPWLAPVNPSVPPGFNAEEGMRFGRLPQEPLRDAAPSVTSDDALSDLYRPGCLVKENAATQWWRSWRELVFVGIADANKPVNPLTSLWPWTTAQCALAGSCLAVCTPGLPCSAAPAADKRIVVLVAGERLSGPLPGLPLGQVRNSNADKGNVANYLEGANASIGDDQYEAAAASATFNDVVVWE